MFNSDSFSLCFVDRNKREKKEKSRRNFFFGSVKKDVKLHTECECETVY